MPDEEPPRSYTPFHADLRFVSEDEHLAVVEKPGGLVVHPGPGHWNDTLVNVLVGRGTDLAGGAAAEAGRPGIVHRLDRDTSGLLVVAKSDLAHRRLAGAMERRAVKRVYAALVWGHLRKSPVDIEAPIARHPKERTRMTVAEGGRHATTHASRNSLTPTCCACGWAPAAPIRSACTSRTSAARSSATASTRSAAAGASRHRRATKRSVSRRWRRASCCTRPRCHSPIP